MNGLKPTSLWLAFIPPYTTCISIHICSFDKYYLSFSIEGTVNIRVAGRYLIVHYVDRRRLHCVITKCCLLVVNIHWIKRVPKPVPSPVEKRGGLDVGSIPLSVKTLHPIYLKVYRQKTSQLPSVTNKILAPGNRLNRTEVLPGLEAQLFHYVRSSFYPVLTVTVLSC